MSNLFGKTNPPRRLGRCGEYAEAAAVVDRGSEAIEKHRNYLRAGFETRQQSSPGHYFIRPLIPRGSRAGRAR
ncbi:hypothetical protein GWI33_009033 [Rhynchophorus ferrugineus]|uniref:Uncharacterized protein n=1 Tax=Rhynchophorus ferrugineus TaxID=354439 RepID=A0A834MAL7_RHYFE|nr:hypothetical protein GWI33_009033 [Rhynchophorus ferrugineus]